MHNQKHLPLFGITVVELGTNLAVPTATRVLADWGARVIKVEEPGGDPWRAIGSQNYCCPVTDEENPIFAVPNANKQFMAINLKQESGQKAMLALLGKADVFVSNIRAKGLSRLGLSYEAVQAVNPGVVYAHFSGYGPKGAEAPRPGYDLTAFWAKGGALIDWTDPGSYPMKPSGGFGDFVTGMSIASGILAALLGRQATGLGTRVDASLYSASIWYNSINVVSAQQRYGNHFPKSKMNPHNPFAGMYQCSDGEWIMININQFDKTYRQLCLMLGLDDLADDPRCCLVQNLKADATLMQGFISRMVGAFAQKSSQEWFDIFFANDLPCEKLMHHADVSTDAQAWDNGYIREVVFTGGTKAVMPCTPVQFSAYPQERYEAYSRIGQHTAAILADIGYADADIAHMAAEKAVVL